MPSTRIETRQGWINGRQSEILEAVQRALVDAVKIPADDRNIRISEFAPSSMIVPTGKSPCYMMIEVSLFTGRTDLLKAVLFTSIAKELSYFGVNMSDIDVILIEIPRTNWGIGGIPASSIELSYVVDI